MYSKPVSSKQIYIRLSKSHDLDLLCLKEAGYNLSEILATVLNSFTSGKSCVITEYKDTDIDIYALNDSRIKCSLKDDDPATNILLKNIKPRQRSAFCKALLRSALSFSVMRPFLAIDYYDKILSSYSSRTLDPDFIYNIEDFATKRNQIPSTKQSTVKRTANFKSDNVAIPKPTETKQVKPPEPEMAETDDNPATIDYNDVDRNNDVTDLFDEFPGLFG